MTATGRALWAQKTPDEILADVDDAIIAGGATSREERRAVFEMLDLDFSRVEARVINDGSHEFTADQQRLIAGADFGSGDHQVVVMVGGYRMPGKSWLRDGLLQINLEMCEARVRQNIERLLRGPEISVAYKIDSMIIDELQHLEKPKPVKAKGAQWKREQRSFGRSCK